MKLKAPILAGLGVLALWLLSGLVKDFFPGDALSGLEGSYQTLLAARARQDKADEAVKRAALRTISEKDAEIARIKAAFDVPSPGEREKDREIASLRRNLAAYEAQGDIKKALEESKKQSAAWEIKFSLAEARHKGELEAAIKAGKDKFDAQVVLTDQGKAALADEKRLHELSRQELGKMAGQLRWARIKGTVGTVLFVGGAAFAGYTLLKGAKK